MSRLKTLLDKGYVRLRGAFPGYRLDAELLLAEAAGIERVTLLTHPELEAASGTEEKYFEFLALRTKKMPIQYILQKAEFMSLDFFVDRRVLIPRPDTEILAEKAIDIIGDRTLRVLELGTGSGALACSIAKYCPSAEITATDLCGGALDVARRNAEVLGVAERIHFLQGDLFGALGAANNSFDILVSNPPYIPCEEIESLDENVRCYEPGEALNGGFDGLDFYRQISAAMNLYLTDKACVLLEIGYNQAEDVLELLSAQGYEAEVIRDLAGLDRVVFGQRVYFTC